jgi:hypothetical protein
MTEPHGTPNLLTSPSDETWKAVRKAVAAAFSVHNIKGKLPMMLGRVNQLVERIRALGPEQPVDVDQVRGRPACLPACMHACMPAFAAARSGLASPLPASRQGPARAPVQAALRVTLDVIGLAGFGHDYGSVALDRPPPEHLLRVLPRCAGSPAARPLRARRSGPSSAAGLYSLPCAARCRSRQLPLSPATATPVPAPQVLHRGHAAHRQPAARPGAAAVQERPQGCAAAAAAAPPAFAAAGPELAAGSSSRPYTALAASMCRHHPPPPPPAARPPPRTTSPRRRALLRVLPVRDARAAGRDAGQGPAAGRRLLHRRAALQGGWAVTARLAARRPAGRPAACACSRPQCRPRTHL